MITCKEINKIIDKTPALKCICSTVLPLCGQPTIFVSYINLITEFSFNSDENITREIVIIRAMEALESLIFSATNSKEKLNNILEE